MRDREELVKLVDRYRLSEARRLMLGLAVAGDFRVVHTALLVAEGRGKFLRARWMECDSAPVPAALCSALRAAAADPSADSGTVIQMRQDLGVLCAGAARHALAKADCSEGRLLGVAVAEPGMWATDFDGTVGWQPLLAAEVVAEQTGAAVISGFPARDLADGGRGWPLHPLPTWLIFADRASRIASRNRLLVQWDPFCTLTWIPKSDGLDAEFPDLQVRICPGTIVTDLLDELTSNRDSVSSAVAPRDPVSDAELVASLRDAGRVEDLPSCHPSQRMRIADGLREWCAEQLNCGVSADRLRRAGYRLISEEVRAMRTAVKPTAEASECVAGGSAMPAELQELLNSEMRNNSGDRGERGITWLTFSEFNYDPGAVEALTAGFLGLLHIDQMPAAVPALTGALNSRILGSLTAGNVASYRRLIMEMGDSSPPAMRLRDAV